MSCAGHAVQISVVQASASQGRRGRDTGSYVDRGVRSEAPHGRGRYVANSWRRTLGPCRCQPLTQHGRGAGDRVTQSHHWAIARAGGRQHRFLLLPTERNECLTS